MRQISWSGAALLLMTLAGGGAARAAPPADAVDAAALRAEIEGFLDAEMESHFSQVQRLDPPQQRVHGALTTGDFSWGTFQRALAAYADARGRREVAGRNVAQWVGRIGLIEAKGGGKAFSQMYAALALRHFGAELAANPVWQSLTAEQREAWRGLLDPRRFYDPKTREVIELAENYLGVAARVATISHEIGVLKDREFVDSLVDRAARPFTSGALYADDAPPSGRYDRYSNEYARYVWMAAERAGRKDVLEALRPTLRRQLALWWDLVSADGYGYPWGRSLGLVSYLDTLEIAAFAAEHPEFRPAPLAELAAAFHAAWRWLRRDYKDDRHLVDVFACGRGNYSYINIEREWQQTTGSLGKLIPAQAALFRVLAAEGVARFPAAPALPAVARFEEFQRAPGRILGVWAVRQGPLRFALPITTGPRGGTADYLPAPHGLPGFAAPVEQVYPALTSFLELPDGRALTASGAASEVQVGPQAQSLRAVWTGLRDAAARASVAEDVGVKTTVEWRLEGATLYRRETFAAARPLAVRRLWMAVPTAGSRHRLAAGEGARQDVLEAPEAQLRLSLIKAPECPVEVSLAAPGDGPLVRGARGALPLHVVYECRELRLDAGGSLSWELALTVSPRDGGLP